MTQENRSFTLFATSERLYAHDGKSRIERFDADRAGHWADSVMNFFDTVTVIFVKKVIPLLLCIGLGYAWRMIQGG